MKRIEAHTVDLDCELQPEVHEKQRELDTALDNPPDKKRQY